MCLKHFGLPLFAVKCRPDGWSKSISWPLPRSHKSQHCLGKFGSLFASRFPLLSFRLADRWSVLQCQVFHSLRSTTRPKAAAGITHLVVAGEEQRLVGWEQNAGAWRNPVTRRSLVFFSFFYQQIEVSVALNASVSPFSLIWRLIFIFFSCWYLMRKISVCYWFSKVRIRYL